MRRLRVEVTQGEIVLENVSVLADTADLVVVYIDTRSKYPGILGVSAVEMLIEATERSLRGDPAKKGEATRVRLFGLRGRWHQAYDIGRYSITWTFYKFGKTHRLLWDNGEV